jgi:hypothetical protein
MSLVLDYMEKGCRSVDRLAKGMKTINERIAIDPSYQVTGANGVQAVSTPCAEEHVSVIQN